MCVVCDLLHLQASGEASAYRTTEDYVRLFGEVMVILGVVISLGYEVRGVWSNDVSLAIFKAMHSEA